MHMQRCQHFLVAQSNTSCPQNGGDEAPGGLRVKYKQGGWQGAARGLITSSFHTEQGNRCACGRGGRASAPLAVCNQERDPERIAREREGEGLEIGSARMRTRACVRVSPYLYLLHLFVCVCMSCI